MKIITATIVSLACATSALAQANPYQSPAPGWVFVQPCGQDPGWVPPTHPLATSPSRICQPPAPAPSPDQPWTTAPKTPFALGRAYTNAYGMVLHVVGATVAYTLDDAGTQVATVLDLRGLVYQSRDLYALKQGASSVSLSPTEPRRTWWELP